ncbi:hypothetical protein QEZ48_14590 [Aquamicrobium lusatiense]|uniref:hypothetical protein n=1 Tax=Aquamicrobium lusatiense TaxID=89772 RepID=UPI002454D6D5|nr:hypothetical protein [Aquamicrobium lusatiense]MDH4992045.1 hypothetical protein [Aquamicrobium lusatiense]
MTQINAKAQIPSPSKGHNSRAGLTERQRNSLEYLGKMIGELSVIAKGERAHLIAYFLDMAYLEAYDILRGSRPLIGDQPKGKSTPTPRNTISAKSRNAAQLQKIG